MSTRKPKKKIVVLVGPTSVGKTGLSLTLARALRAEIVSADSMQIYRGMDIGTAKPTRQEMRSVPHHLIDVVNPDEMFNAKRYQEAADHAVQSILHREKVPLVVGGTGLYVKALLHGLFPAAELEPGGTAGSPPRNTADRDVPAPFTVLAQVDPAAAGRIHPNDRVRAQRALDVFTRTGTSITVWQAKHRFREDRYDALVVGLRMEREILYRRIHNSVNRMVREGLLEEVRGLIDRGYSPDLPSMQSLGYRHMAGVLDGSWSMELGVETMKRDTRRYAKRQMTWFQNQESVAWFEGENTPEKISVSIQRFLNQQINQIVEKPAF